MKKFVIAVYPEYFSRFDWQAGRTVPVLTNYADALRFCYSTAWFIVRKLKAAGYDAIVEAVHE